MMSFLPDSKVKAKPAPNSFSPSSSMSISGIQGRILEVTVVCCTKLKDTEWISRQDPYVCLEYANTKNRTRTCTDGGKNPTFQEKFVFPLIEGLRELNVVAWNSNTVSHDDFIGSGKIQLQKVLSSGFDDCSWPLQTKTGRHAGEVRLIMHYADANKPATSHTPSYTPSAPPAVPHYSSPPMGSSYHPAPPPHSSYPPAPPPHSSYPPAPAPHSSYPPSSTGYPPPPYYPPQHAAYPPSPYAPYPPPAHDPHYYPPGSYPPPSSYPPPPY